MGKWKLFTFATLVFLAASATFASAYINQPHGTKIVYGFNGDFYSRDYRYVDYYGAPVLRVYTHSRFENDDFWEYVNKVRYANFVEDSFNDRYKLTAGTKSGDAFCNGCERSGSKTAWGEKKAFSIFDRNRNYYEPRYDYKLEKFNWRF